MDPNSRRTVRIVLLPTDADLAAVAACCERIRSLLNESPGAVVECDVSRLSGSAAQVIGALARIRLVTLDCGSELTLCRADPALRTALDLFGLADVLPVSAGEE